MRPRKVILIFVIIILSTLTFTNQAYQQTPSQAIITTENAHLVEQLGLVGNGSFFEMEWISQDKSVAVASSAGVWLYDDITSHTPPLLLSDQREVATTLALNADRELIAYADGNGVIQLWDMKSRTMITKFKIESMSIDEIRFSPNGNMIAIADYRGGLSLLDTESGNILTVRSEMRAPIRFLSNEKIFFVDSDSNVGIWDFENQTTELIFTQGAYQIEDIDFDPSGEIVAIADRNGTLTLIDRNQATEAVIHDHTPPVNAIKLSDDGKFLASVSDKMIKVWSTETYELLLSIDLRWTAEDILFSSDSRQIISITSNGNLYYWDTADGHLIYAQENPVGYSEAIIAVSDRILVATYTDKQKIELWEINTPDDRVELPESVEPTFQVAYDPINDIVAYTGANYSTEISPIPINLYSLTTHSSLPSLVGQGSEVSQLIFSSDGRYLFSVGRDFGKGSILGWEVSSSRQFFDIRDLDSPVNSITVDPANDFLVIGQSDGKIQAWNLETGGKYFDLDGHIYGVEHVLFSPTGSLFASAGIDGSIFVWDSNTQNRAASLKGHEGNVCCISFNLNDTIIASGGWDNTIRLWNAQSGESLITLRGHSDRIESLTFSDEGRLLVSLSRDQTIILWGIPFE